MSWIAGEEADVTRGDLHITVVTGFGEGPATLEVAHETALVKAALLYACHVTLASPRVALLMSVAPILAADEADRAAVILEMIRNVPGQADVVSRVSSLQRKKRPSVDERYLLRDLKAILQ